MEIGCLDLFVYSKSMFVRNQGASESHGPWGGTCEIQNSNIIIKQKWEQWSYCLTFAEVEQHSSVAYSTLTYSACNFLKTW